MNKRNNILYMIDNFCGIGGTERHLYYLSMHLSRDKFKPYVVVFDLKDNPLIADMKKAGIPVSMKRPAPIPVVWQDRLRGAASNAHRQISP